MKLSDYSATSIEGLMKLSEYSATLIECLTRLSEYSATLIKGLTKLSEYSAVSGKCSGNVSVRYFTMSTAMVVMSEASEIQNEVERTLLPFTVACRFFVSLGST